MTPICYECIHRREIPGDCHSKCAHPRFGQIHVTANAHGIKRGWFDWPDNFDPAWLETCDGFEKEEKL